MVKMVRSRRSGIKVAKLAVGAYRFMAYASFDRKSGQSKRRVTSIARSLLFGFRHLRASLVPSRGWLRLFAANNLVKRTVVPLRGPSAAYLGR